MKYINVFIVVVAAVMGLSACAQFRSLHTKDEANEWTLRVRGEPVDKAIKGRSLEELLRDKDSKVGQALAQLSEELKADGIDLEKADGQALIRKQLKMLRDGTASADEFAAPLRGIEGFSTALFLRAVLGERFEVKGNIRDYVYIAETQSGHLSVDMTTKIFLPEGGFRKHFLHWDIELLKGGFVLHKRQGSPSNPRNPFPNIPGMELPDDSLNPDSESSIWARGLNLKLFAKGVKAMKIRNVYRQVDDGPITRLSSNRPHYRVTAKSCVDLLTKGYPPGGKPASTVPPKNATELFDAQGDFCLGRCAHPYIVNTGGD